MASLGKLGQLTEAEYADLVDRVDRFHAAWTKDGATALEPFLPTNSVRSAVSVRGRTFTSANATWEGKSVLKAFRASMAPVATSTSVVTWSGARSRTVPRTHSA